nr:hypothetical protein [Halobaculum sp. DT31]
MRPTDASPSPRERVAEVAVEHEHAAVREVLDEGAVLFAAALELRLPACPLGHVVADAHDCGLGSTAPDRLVDDVEHRPLEVVAPASRLPVQGAGDVLADRRDVGVHLVDLAADDLAGIEAERRQSLPLREGERPAVVDAEQHDRQVRDERLQPVVHRLQFPPVPEPLGDVRQREHHARDLAGAVEQRRPVHTQHLPRPVGPVDRVTDALHRFAGVQDATERQFLVGDRVAVEVADPPLGVVVRPGRERGLGQPEHLLRAVVGEDEPPLAVQLDDTAGHRLHHLFEAALAVLGPCRRPVCLDGVLDPVGEDRVRLAAAPLLEVVGDAGGDGLAGDLLAPLPCEQHEREGGVALADAAQQFDAVGVDQLVVRDDTVDRPRVERGERLGGVGGPHRLHPAALEREHLGRERTEVGVVVDV